MTAKLSRQEQTELVSKSESIYIVSGEGDGKGISEEYEGIKSLSGIEAKLQEERCGGDRWARAEVITDKGSFNLESGEQI